MNRFQNHNSPDHGKHSKDNSAHDVLTAWIHAVARMQTMHTHSNWRQALRSQAVPLATSLVLFCSGLFLFSTPSTWYRLSYCLSRPEPTVTATRVFASATPTLHTKPLHTSFLPPGAGYEPLSFRTLRLYIPGKKPPQEVLSWNGKFVEIMGFMSALTQLEDITEFVLASSPPMNCFCHPPLRVNEVIFIQMNKGKKTDFKGGVVKVRGRLEVNTNVIDEFADIMYTIYCDEVL